MIVKGFPAHQQENAVVSGQGIKKMAGKRKTPRSDILPMAIGGVLGLALAGYAVVYLPMQRNYDECGKVTICDIPPRIVKDD